jgi:7-cyano-7-deazaguanine synthase
MDVPHTILNLDQVFTQFESNSALLSAQVSVPNGHYADESMRITVVPNRNMILLSVAIGFAISKGFNEVAYAAHSGDHAVYKDCTPEFLEPLSLAAKNCDWNPVTIWAPFLNISKTEIARIGNRLSVPWEDTYSCYNGQEIQCGTCGTCVERLEALRDAQL